MITVIQGIMLEILALYPGSSPAEKRERSLGTRLRNYISNQNLQVLEWCWHTQSVLEDGTGPYLEKGDNCPLPPLHKKNQLTYNSVFSY